jgi:hypothetical protein
LKNGSVTDLKRVKKHLFPSSALEHSKVCTLSDFGLLQFTVKLFDFHRGDCCARGVNKLGVYVASKPLTELDGYVRNITVLYTSLFL